VTEVTESERKAAMDFLVAMNMDFAIQDEAKMGSLRAKFLTEFGVDVTRNPDYVVQLLESACVARNSTDVELALAIGLTFGVFEDPHIPGSSSVLVRLLESDWHESHEDIAETLESMRAPEAVEPLYRTALVRYPYLDYDEAYALGVKCVWGLGEIGTPEAVDRLRLLAACDNEVIRENAAYQLERLGVSHGQG